MMIKSPFMNYFDNAKHMTEANFEELLWAVAEEILSCSAHDMDHVRRVYQLALEIAAHYSEVDYGILIPAVLLHDIGRRHEDQDPTGQIDHAKLGAAMAREILERMQCKPEVVSGVCTAIESHRFRSGSVPSTLEAEILFDADKLDAIGAVGVARAFMLAGQEGSKMYRHVNSDAYEADNLTENGRIMRLEAHAPNVEYDVKLKHIPERLMTEKARQMAFERMAVMKIFFDALEREIGIQK